MKLTERSLAALVAAAALMFAVGCATQRQVNIAVAESNAALVSPYLDRAQSGGSGGTWKEAVSKLDRLIAAHPTEKTLVNHLKVRQAMLLTANRQDSLATMRWKDIDPGALKTERDRALYDNHDTLVWWYDRAADRGVLAAPEVSRANASMKRLSETIQALRSPELRIFLGTLRAQVALKVNNQEKTNNDAQRRSLAQRMADDLKAYVDLFSEGDIDWVRANKGASIKADEIELLDVLRNRVWLRKMIEDYRVTAGVQGLRPAWVPGWIGDY